MTPAATPEALVESFRQQLAGSAVYRDGVPLHRLEQLADALIAGPLAPILAALATATAERDLSHRTNDLLRAALANSGGPCVYCTLPREEWVKCEHGFPGCGRADDAMLCPHFGAEMEANDRADTATAEAASLRVEVEAKDRRIADLTEVWTDEEGKPWFPPSARTYAAICNGLVRAGQRLTAARAAVEALKAALKPFADAADAYPVSDVARREDRRREEVIWSYGCEDKGNRREITVADIRAARTALARAATAGEGRSDG
ncbi:hypothetical protein FHR71_005653 [Methylobacterium sp. RAS18]|nr:hypothetical protein [Methylobacterium sp. RAS18]